LLTITSNRSPHASSPRLTLVNPAYYWDTWHSLWGSRMSPECQQTQSRIDIRASLNAQARTGIGCTTKDDGNVTRPDVTRSWCGVPPRGGRQLQLCASVTRPHLHQPGRRADRAPPTVVSSQQPRMRGRTSYGAACDPAHDRKAPRLTGVERQS
jgi:hypothetical protein